MNYAEKQNNANYHYKKKDNTYFIEESSDYEYVAPIQIPKRFLSLFNTYHPNCKSIIKGDIFEVFSKSKSGKEEESITAFYGIKDLKTKKS